MTYFFVMQNYMSLDLSATGGWPEGYDEFGRKISGRQTNIAFFL
jgi:hypothetical protein